MEFFFDCYVQKKNNGNTEGKESLNFAKYKTADSRDAPVE